MDITQEFKEKIRLGQISEAITLAMNEALELKITTRTDNKSEEISRNNDGNCIYTSINMLEGRIENEVGKNLIENGSYDQVKEFHLALVQQGSHMILKHMESLQKIYTVLNQTLLDLPELETSSQNLPESESRLYLSEENP